MPTTDGFEHGRVAHPDFPHLSAEGSGRGRRRGCIVAIIAFALVVVVVAVGYAGVSGLLRQLSSSECRVHVGGQEQTFSPEQTANAATISAVAVRRGLPARAATIALTTAIQESKLRNLRYGDRDSLGLFQQRPSQGWGSAGEVQDPVHASGAFYDHLVAIPGYEDRGIGEMAQQVQRSGYPTAYAEHEDAGRVLASVLTGQSPAGIGCQLKDPSGSSSPSSTAGKVTAAFGLSPSHRKHALTVRAGTGSAAWAVGAWAVAHADAEQVTAVTVGDRTWTRGMDDDAWSWHPARHAVDARTVRITLA